MQNKDYGYEVEVNTNPMTKRDESKKKNTLSTVEWNLINKIVYSIKMGWMKPKVPKEKIDPFEKFF